MENAVLLTALCLIGACLGSFSATAALRLVEGDQSLFGRSRCDGCGARLSFARTVPVIAYVSSRGVCRDCGRTIDPAHLVGEIAGVAIVLAAIAAPPPARSIAIAALGLILLASAVVDARTRALPDGLTVAAAAFCAILAWLRSQGSIVIGLFAAAAAFLVLEFLRRGFRSLRGQPGLGFGDVKLISALALWLGPATPWAVALASACGLAFARLRPPPDGRLAFGPFIAAAGFVVGVAREAGPWR